jgi:antirestriction protein ArdC
VAEFESAYLLNHVGIQQENTVAYIQGWIHAIKQDRNLLMKAASQGEKAYNYILGGKNES